MLLAAEPIASLVRISRRSASETGTPPCCIRLYRLQTVLLVWNETIGLFVGLNECESDGGLDSSEEVSEWKGWLR